MTKGKNVLIGEIRKREHSTTVQTRLRKQRRLLVMFARMALLLLTPEIVYFPQQIRRVNRPPEINKEF